MNLEKVEKSFIKIAAIFLMATATIKLASAGQEVPFLTKTDPIFWFFTNRQVLFFAGLLELVVAAFLFFHTNTSLRIKTIAWLATIFLVYRIGVWLTGYRGPCNCLGGALDWLIKDRIVIENISKVLLGFFLCSYLLIFIRRKAGFRSGEVKHTSSFSSSFKSLIALILLMTPIYGHAQIFEVNGEIDFSAYNGDGSSYT
ncbi:MAG: MauE/DoxX family redox-associated membrane protein, partial [Limisphaerales bacterium]